jgi:hypothetical protein
MEAVMKITRQELCKKIEEVIPNAGVCGIDFDVTFDESVHAWAVDLHRGQRHLQTFIETDEADNCMAGKSCIPLAMQIAQLKRNFELASCAEQ